MPCWFVGKRNVAELERLATAAWIRVNQGITAAMGVASPLHEFKPHVSLPDAEIAADEALTIFDITGTTARFDHVG